MDKKIIIIISSIIALVLIGLLTFFLISGNISKQQKLRDNTVKNIKFYMDKGDYDRALDLIDELLKENYNDKEALELRDKIADLKEDKKQQDDLAKAENEKKLLEELDKKIDKSNETPFIIKDLDDKKYTSENKKEDERLKKIKTFIDEGINEYNNKNFAKAKDKFLKALDLDNNNSHANAFLGMTLYDENPKDDKNVQEAIVRIKRALKEDDNIAEAHYKLAEIYNEKNLNDAAIEEYKKTLRLDPDKYEAYYSLGKIYYNQKDYKNAEENFKLCVKLKPDYIYALFYLGNTELKLNKTDESKQYFIKSLAYDPKFYQAYSMLGEIYYNQNDYSNALNNFKKAAEITNQYRYHHKIAECYEGLKQYDKAIESYLTSLSLNPKSQDKDKELAAEAYENMAEIEKNRSKFKESLVYANKGLELNSSSSYLYYILGFSKSKLGQFDDAVKDYNKALELKPDDVVVYINLSKLYNETGKYDESINAALKGLSVDNKQYKLYNNLGDSYQKLSKFQEAINSYKESIRINSTDAIIYYNLGMCYNEIKDTDNAILSFQQAVNINANFYDAYYELGQAYFTINKYDETKSIFKNLLQKKPDYPKRDQIDKILAVIGN